MMPMSRKSMLARTVYQPSQWRIFNIQIVALRMNSRYVTMRAQLCSCGRQVTESKSEIIADCT